ncbi:MAG: DUF305 domain-containing protein [Actinomycetota bacterium]|nr:DUF305 domain-containing protein [Actinomycetota bacterium]
MTTRTRMTLVAAAAAITVGATLGGCGTNATPPSSSATSSPPVAQIHNQADITFAQGMIPHHAQAIAMSKMAAQRAVSPQVKDLAARIQAAQQPEIDQMSGFLRAWNAPVPSTNNPMDGMGQGDMMGQMHGAMPGMMSGGQMHQLGQSSGDAFDRMFLEMMITHHQGAISMAKTELSNGQNPDARRLAQRIIDAQQREITGMRTLLGA